MNVPMPWCPPPQDCEPCPPPFPCPPAPPGPPPWYSPPTPPWYPGANGGVSFGTDYPQNPCRGHFLWDGTALWLWDGVSWQKIGGSSGGTAQAAVAAVGATPPLNPIAGMLWWNGSTLMVWDGTAMIWKPVSAAPKGGLIGVNFYMASQAISIPSGVTQAFVQMWGGSGGSGGANNSFSAGTGGAGYLEKFLTGLVAGNTMNFTFGAAGAGGTVGGAGTAGGNSSLSSGSQSIPMMTAGGSPGTPPGTATTWPAYFAPGGAGGTATGGDINIAGTNGFSTPENTSVWNALAGSNNFSEGATGVGSAGPAGGAGPAVSGNAGTPGGLKITWYS